MASTEDRLLSSLEVWFRPVRSCCTAFSGGVDSSLVLFLSRRFVGGGASAVIADSPSLKRSDLNLAREFCDRHSIPLHELKTGEVGDPRYAANPPDRCFFCKEHLYTRLREFTIQSPGCVLLNGTNSDDLGEYRPGLGAAHSHSIRSPLAECGVGKTAVRGLARKFDLPVWEKPASPCLSSRIPYGEVVTKEKLARIEAAEAVLAGNGFPECRVRHIEGEARLEVPVADIRRLLENGPLRSEIQRLGFSRVVVDEEGLVSGKMNRVLGV